MKKVFGIDGVIVGAAMSMQPEAVISSNIDGTTEFEVPDDSLITVGWTYIIGGDIPVFSEPPPAPPPVDPCEKLIDIGPFFDRFGASKMAVLTSANPVIKAIVQDVTVRKWVDLSRDDVLQSVNYLLSQGLITEEVKTAVLVTPVTETENAALRKVYFS